MPDTSVDLDELEKAREKYRFERDKRLDPHRAEILDLRSHAEYLDDPYTKYESREPVADEVDVIVVGAGFGGLMAVGHLRKQGIKRIRVIEKAGDVGGVWYWNRYPEAQCDVEAYIYLPMLEEVGYVPKLRYAYQPEIFEYSQLLAKHLDVYTDALFQTSVSGMTWDDAAGQWRVRTDRGDDIRARYVVVALGSFSALKMPAIPGISSFEGKIFHSARWDYDYTGGAPDKPLDKLADKTVGLIGTGASGIQILAPIAEAARHLYVFQRTPSTVAVRDNRETDIEWFHSQEPGWVKRRRDNFTTVMNGEVAREDLVADGWTVFNKAVLGPIAGELTDEERALMREEADLQHMENIRARIGRLVRDPEVAEKLKPYYRYLCKRPAFHDRYLPAFNRGNVTLVDSDGHGIDRITAHGVVVQGQEYEVDALVVATGFDQDAPYTERVGFDIVGRNGTRLSDKWADGPETFQGLMTSGFPNFFFQATNNMQGTATTNFIHALDEVDIQIAAIISELDRRDVIGDPTKEAEDDYVSRVVGGGGLVLSGGNAFLEGCTPGRWNNEGRLSQRRPKSANYPGTSTQFFAYLARWREEGTLEGLRLTPRAPADAQPPAPR